MIKYIVAYVLKVLVLILIVETTQGYTMAQRLYAYGAALALAIAAELIEMSAIGPYMDNDNDNIAASGG